MSRFPKKLPIFAGLCALVTGVAFAQETAPALKPLRTFASYEFGQFEGGTNNKGDDVKELISHASVWILQEATLNEHARVRAGVGAAYFFVSPRSFGDNPFSHSKRSAVGLTEAHGEFDIASSGDDMWLQLKAGVFGYKYNPDAKNLGEYMYRTWTYPNVITTGGLDFVNSAAAQLTGLSALTRIGGLKNEVLLTVETDRPPVHSLSLADMVSYNLGGILEVGGGFMFNNFYNPDPAQVTARKPENSYYTLSDGRKMAAGRYDYEVQNGLILPAVTIQDTNYYTLEGQKVMVRAAVDLGKMVSLAPNQFKVYGEAILLGIKDYPTYYEKLSDRMVYMAGLNVPTFGLLNMLAFEVEYAPNPFENSTEGPLTQGSVTPYVGDAWGSYQPYDDDDLKWTVQARKDVYPGFFIYAQVANDHVRMLDVYSSPDFREFMPDKKNFYWAVKLAYAL
ncbi:MAG: hypothetical protein K0Q91_962 [Fibrobacteria bacterium]|jgi:hypothetical protein|nr:hypothetical protein [Fibrobacteria bacterium]